MINVLPHCQDAGAVFATIDRILKAGGILVFAEWPRERSANSLWDAGHPLGVKADYMAEFLEGFDPIYSNGWYQILRKPK